MILSFRDSSIDLSIPRIMGILNITPDSFSDGALYLDPDKAIKRALHLEACGADIIDIGAESTRPGSTGVTRSEELNRLLPVVEGIISQSSIPLSIDTSKADVAEECLKKGAHIINDVSACRKDPQMASVIKKYEAAVILMHMRGNPATMNECTQYGDIVRDVLSEIHEAIEYVRARGVLANHIAIDPGIGFAKTCEQNIEIIRRLREFQSLGYPLVLGTSRKSFIGKVLQRETHERLSGTLASCLVGVKNGAAILRVHDVQETKDFLKMVDLLQSPDKNIV
jgi:dihydropteroate synthase